MPNPIKLIRTGRWRSRWLLLVVAFIVLLAIVVIGIELERHRFSRSLPTLERSLRTRQLTALRAYASRESTGVLLPPDNAVIAVREEFLQQVIVRSLPLRQVFPGGDYVARLDSAGVRLEDGLAVVTLSGRGMLAGKDTSTFYADLHLQGLFTISDVDPASGILQANIVITEVRVRRGGPLSLLHPAVRYFSHLQVEDWNRLGQRIRLPLKVDQEIIFPAVEGDVNLPETRIPLSVRVRAVTTLQRRLAVSLTLLPDSAKKSEVSPEHSTNGKSGVVSQPRRRRLREWFGNDRRREEENLHARIKFLAQQDSLWQGVTASDHDIVAIIPEPILKSVTAKIFQRYLKGVTIDLPALEAKIDEKLTVKILGAKTNVGRISGKIHIANLQGELTIAGDTRLMLIPPDELAITLPIRVLRGGGKATFDMEWDPGWLSSVLCRSFDMHETLVGKVLPFQDEFTTRVRFSIHDSSLVGRPRIQRDRVGIRVALADNSWAKVREVLVEQDRLNRCGIMMNPDTLMSKLKKSAYQGIQIRLPDKIFKPFYLPVTLETEYETAGYHINAKAYAPEIEVKPTYLRLAFQTALRVHTQY